MCMKVSEFRFDPWGHVGGVKGQIYIKSLLMHLLFYYYGYINETYYTYSLGVADVHEGLDNLI